MHGDPFKIARLRELFKDPGVRRRALTHHAPWWRAYPKMMPLSNGAMHARMMNDVRWYRERAKYAVARELLIAAKSSGRLCIPLPT